MGKTMKHPLINEESRNHYTGSNGVPTVIEMEENMTVDEMIGFCRGNIMKYEARKDKKGQAKSDQKKIETYRKYLSFMTAMLAPFIGSRYTTVRKAMSMFDLKWEEQK